jgi:hypothetical protein
MTKNFLLSLTTRRGNLSSTSGLWKPSRAPFTPASAHNPSPRILGREVPESETFARDCVGGGIDPNGSCEPVMDSRIVMANVRIKSSGYTIPAMKTQELSFWWGADYYPAGCFDVSIGGPSVRLRIRYEICPVPRGRVVLYEHGRRLHARARRFRLATEFAQYVTKSRTAYRFAPGGLSL